MMMCIGACLIRMGARVCYSEFQVSVKLPREALEDEERSRRDSVHAICHPTRYPRNRVRTCDLVSQSSQVMMKIGEPCTSYLDRNSYSGLAHGMKSSREYIIRYYVLSIFQYPLFSVYPRIS